MPRADRSSYLERRYGREQRLVHWREQQLVDELLGRLARPVRRALDAPCGHGRLIGALRRLASEQVVALDLNRRRMRALLEAEPTASGAPLAVLEVDLARPLPFDDGAFDLVLCFRLLQHVRDRAAQQRLLGELARVSGRYLLLSYYAAGTLHALQRRLKIAVRGERRATLSMIRPEVMRETFAAAGLEVLEDRPLLPGLHAQRVVLLERAAAPALPTG